MSNLKENLAKAFREEKNIPKKHFKTAALEALACQSKNTKVI